jgi:hypothetical protein
MCTTSLLDQECYIIDEDLEDLVYLLTTIKFDHIEQKDNLRMCINCFECLRTFNDYRTNCINIHDRLIKLDLREKIEELDPDKYVVEELTETNDEMIEFTETDDEELLLNNPVKNEEIVYAVEKILSDSEYQEEIIISKASIKASPSKKLDTSMEKGKEIYQKLLQKCLICGKMIEKNRMEGHINKHNNLRPYSCTECNKEFYCKQLLRLHKTSIHTNIKVKCEICDKLFPSARALYSHNLRHKNENRYVCSLCDKKFNNSNSLKRHMAIHSGVREFVCSICGVGFYRRFNLDVHIKNVHNQTKEFICTYDDCKKSFGYARLLKDHIRKHHQVSILENVEF